MNTMLAYCGLTCNCCPIHLATLEPDKERQRTMRDEIARFCKETYGMNLESSEITDCDGCLANGRLFSGCLNCEIRRCATKRSLENCAFCNEYACTKLLKLFNQEPDAKVRLDEIRNK